MKIHFIKNQQRGQTVMEYLILSALIGIFCLGAVQRIGSKIKSQLNQVHTKINNINVTEMN